MYVNRRLGKKYWYSNRDMNKEQKEEFSEHQLILLEEKKQKMASPCDSSLQYHVLYFCHAYFTTFGKCVS